MPTRPLAFILLASFAALTVLPSDAGAVGGCAPTPGAPTCVDARLCTLFGVGPCGTFSSPAASGRYFCVVVNAPGAACGVLADGRPAAGVQVGFGASPQQVCVFEYTTFPVPWVAQCVRLLG